MRIGLSVYDLPAADVLALAVAAEEFGFDTLWLGEHLLLPMAYASVHPTHGQMAHQHHVRPIIEPGTELLDPWVTLGALAGATRRIRLATGMYLLPLRHPLVTARHATTLHEISRGRFLLGVGVGWLQEEFDALGIPFAERGRRVDESITILRDAWRGGPFEHEGEHFRFGRVQISPRPVEVPLIVGGNSDRALRRAARAGDGWFSSGTPSFDDALRLRDRLYAELARQGRTGPFPCFVRVEGVPEPATIERYAAEGVEDLVVWADRIWPTDAGPPEARSEARRRALAAAADRFGLEASAPVDATITS